VGFPSGYRMVKMVRTILVLSLLATSPLGRWMAHAKRNHNDNQEIRSDHARYRNIRREDKPG
jgi:hypothetical protein